MKNKILRLLLMAAFLMGAALLLVMAARTQKRYDDGDRVYEDLAQAYVSSEPDQGNGDDADYLTPVGEESRTKEEDLPVPPSVDHAGLQRENGDYAAWISYPAAGVDYPVVHGPDDSWYLHRNFHKAHEFHGTLFMAAECRKDFLSRHTVIYGHNMKNGSMFGSLRRLADKETRNKDRTFWLCTPERSFLCTVFSVRTVGVNDRAYTLFDRTEEEDGTEAADAAYTQWVGDMARYADDGFAPEEDDRIITLSTCTGNSSTRLIVQATIAKEAFHYAEESGT